MPQLAVKMTGAPNYPSWYVPTSGKLAYKSGAKGGGSWVIPAGMQVKSAGAWKDTGYVGYPAVPSAPWVNSWDYANVGVAWSAGDGGAPVTAWHVQVNNEGNVGIAGWDPASYPQTFGVSQDTKYYVYVRARGATGLYSAWSAPLKIWIGHPEWYTYHNEQRSGAWGTGNYGYDLYRNQYGGQGFSTPAGYDALLINNMGHSGYVNAAYLCDNSVQVGRWIDVYYKGPGGYGGNSYRHGDVHATSVWENLYMAGDSRESTWLGFHLLDVGGWSYQPPGVHMWGEYNFQGTLYWTVSVQDVHPAQGNQYW